MSETSSPISPKLTFYLLTSSMLATVVSLRLYLHLVNVQHIYPGGYLFHHLYTGVLITVPAAFVLAFGTRFLWLAIATRVALGVGSGPMLDEMTFLVMTKATDEDYVSSVSLIGALVFVGGGLILAFGLYRWHESKRSIDGDPTAEVPEVDGRQPSPLG